MGKKHKPEEIIGKLREAEVVLAQGGTVRDACRRRLGGTEQTYYRWRDLPPPSGPVGLLVDYGHLRHIWA